MRCVLVGNGIVFTPVDTLTVVKSEPSIETPTAAEGRSGMLAEVERQGAQILDTKFEARTCPETKSSESKPKATKFACIALHTTMYQEMYPSVRDKI